MPSVTTNCPDCGHPMELRPYLGHYFAWVCPVCNPKATITTTDNTTTKDSAHA